MSLVEGEASYLRADGDGEDSWTAVSVNAPLVTGDRFYSAAGSRADLQLAPGVYARLSADTEIDLLDLSPEAIQARVGSGTATFRLRHPPRDQAIELDTANVAVVVRERGVYRLDVDPEANRTTVIVREGAVDLYSGGQSSALVAGRAATIDGTGDEAQLVAFDASPEDDWDRWEVARSGRIERSASYRYVSTNVYGAEDLDDYGTWTDHPRYGHIWRPCCVDAGWAPFTTGRWVWVDPWGWNWVEYQPWGWAPVHYGRWVSVEGFWAWAPGPIVPRPAFAPAVAGFVNVVNGHVSWGVSIGVGAVAPVAWVPLGFGEPIVPWWGGFAGVTIGRPWWGGWGGPRIVNKTVINQTTVNNINVNNIRFVNLGQPSAVTAVSRESFVSGRFRHGEVQLEPASLQKAKPLVGRIPVAPTQESLAAVDPGKVRGRHVAKPRAEALQREAVALRDPPPAPPKLGKKLGLVESRRAPVPPAELRRLAAQSSKPIVGTVKAHPRSSVGRGEGTASVAQRENLPRGAGQAGEARRPTHGRAAAGVTAEQKGDASPSVAGSPGRSGKSPPPSSQPSTQTLERPGRAPAEATGVTRRGGKPTIAEPGLPPQAPAETKRAAAPRSRQAPAPSSLRSPTRKERARAEPAPATGSRVEGGDRARQTETARPRVESKAKPPARRQAQPEASVRPAPGDAGRSQAVARSQKMPRADARRSPEPRRDAAGSRAGQGIARAPRAQPPAPPAAQTAGKPRSPKASKPKVPEKDLTPGG